MSNWPRAICSAVVVICPIDLVRPRTNGNQIAIDSSTIAAATNTHGRTSKKRPRPDIESDDTTRTASDGRRSPGSNSGIRIPTQ